MRSVLLAFAVALASLPALAAQDSSFELRGTGWVNSKEMSLERLKGKVVVLYFFSDQ